MYAHLIRLSHTNPRFTEYKPLIKIASIIFGLSQVIPLLAFAYITNFTTDPQVYLDNLIAKCPPDTIEKVFHERAFPYIGKTALGYFAYLGILCHHSFLTSNTTNQGVDLWKSLLRLFISLVFIFPALWQLKFVTWQHSIYLLYLNKTFLPCGYATWILCSFAEPLFEHLNLMNRDYAQRYCVFVHHKN